MNKEGEGGDSRRETKTDSHESEANLDRLSHVDLKPYLEKFLTGIIAVVLFFMMLITVIDVIGRSFFHAPFPGTSEIVEVLMALTIFAAVPLVSALRARKPVDDVAINTNLNTDCSSRRIRSHMVWYCCRHYY